MLGMKIYKKEFSDELYDEAVNWANANGGTIEDRGDYYKVVSGGIKELTFAEKRSLAYPPIADQLDMLYWDKVNGTNNWEAAISAVKAKYPKE